MCDQIRHPLFSPEWVERFRRSEKTFTRTRHLPFHGLVTFLLNLRKGSTEQEFNGFFAALKEQPLASAAPNVSALFKARQRLSAEVFPALKRQAIDSFRAGPVRARASMLYLISKIPQPGGASAQGEVRW
ncbi:hypothetical protein G3480_25160 [Thiorhodococcus mannitoliphagus]|uniref:Uncharacterized protein n=1 Tax=Thiorhodococcus mannitoliphagus TaxID=329406 RepID=A0A6P1E161_9GAMM|nr:hypothetical protein [Thiorhodococcus mannitoliphagus]